MLTGLSVAGACAQPNQDKVEQATQLMQAQQLEPAITLLQSVVTAEPKRVDGWNLLGIARAETGDSKGAEAAFRQGLKIAPQAVSINENLGFLLFQKSDYTGAAKYLERAVAEGSEKPGVKFSLAASRLRTGNGAAARTELVALEPELRDRAEYWEERGRAELGMDAGVAEESFDKALDRQPKSLAGLNGAAQAAVLQGNDEKALAYLVRARQIDSTDVPTALHFAEVCIRRDLGLDARDALEAVHRKEPGNKTTLFLLARANVSLQNWQQAADLFTEYLRAVPSYAPAHFALGWVDVRLNKLDEAREQLKRALQLDSKLVDARYELAQLELDAGDETEAEAQLKIVLNDAPRHAKANVAAAKIALQRGDMKAAQTYLETALQTDPNEAAAHYNLATVLARMGQGDRAAQERLKATELAEQSKQNAHRQLRLVTP